MAAGAGPQRSIVTDARADAGDPARDAALPVHDGPDVRPGPVHQRRRLGGVDALYANVPETTEQILHPEKYQAGEGPVEIDVPEDLATRIGPDWNLALDDTFGEFQTGVWLRDADAANATEAAAGWGGDRVLVATMARAMHGRPCWPRNGTPRRMRRSSRHRRVPWSRRWTIRPRCSPAGRTPAAGSWSRAATTCSRRSQGRSAGGLGSRGPGRYIESGAEIPSNPRALASVIRVASASASRFAERSGSAGSTTRASR